MSDAPIIAVADDPERARYEVRVDGRLAGYCTYSLAGDRITFTHTKIFTQFEHHGVGSRLAHETLDDVRRRGLHVVAKCPFIAAFIEEHEEYQDLLA